MELLDSEIKQDEVRKAELEQQLKALSAALADHEDALLRKYDQREQYNRTLAEAQAAYEKVQFT
jgi:septal ring factor EnvC (AmiA/AmiB activator)